MGGHRRQHGLVAGLACLLFVAGAFAREPVRRALTLVVVVHPERAVRAFSESELRDMFLKRKTTWRDGAPISVVAWSARTPERVAFDRGLLHLSPSASARYWLDRRVRGQGLPPRGLRSARTIQLIVARRSNTIAYVPEEALVPAVRAVARITWRDGQLVVEPLSPGRRP